MKLQRVHRGGFLLQITLVLAIVMIITAVGMERISRQLDQQIWQQTAEQFAAVASATEQYLADYPNTLDLTMPTVSVSPVTSQLTNSENGLIALLQEKYFLAANFPEKNPYGQHYKLGIKKEGGQRIPLLLAQGGSPPPLLGQNYIARALPGLGGHIDASNNAKGAMGNWQLSAAEITRDYHLQTVAAGDLALLLPAFTGDNSLTAAEKRARQEHILHRSGPQNGNTQGSNMHNSPAQSATQNQHKMSTALDMGEHNINNIGKITADKVKFGSNLTLDTQNWIKFNARGSRTSITPNQIESHTITSASMQSKSITLSGADTYMPLGQPWGDCANYQGDERVLYVKDSEGTLAVCYQKKSYTLVTESEIKALKEVVTAAY